jgi:hypothetical protein
MPTAPLPQVLLQAATRLLTARAALRLRRRRNGPAQQAKAFAGLIPRLAAASVWRSEGIEAGMAYREFQRRVPLRAYEDFAPAIGRMRRGEPDVLLRGTCALYAVSSGTTAGRTKYLPINAEMLRHFEVAGLNSLLAYTARVGRTTIFRGRHLFLGGSTALTPLPDSRPFVAHGGDLSGISAQHLPRWVERHLYEPGRAIAQMADWPAKIEAIVQRTAALDITTLAGIPSWVLILADALRDYAARARGRPPHLQAIWPNFECFIHGGVPLGPFQDELRSALGPTVHFHEVYPASEAFIAVQDAEAGAGLRLLAGAGIFYEFLPLAEFDPANLVNLGPRALTLAEVRPGIDYVLLLTTPAGLARYVIGDVVRFISLEPPRLIYVGRTQLQLSAFGEHVIEREITEALLKVSRHHGWTIANFHVAPLFASSLTGERRGRHEWWIEFKPGGGSPAPGPEMGRELDLELRRLNEDYDAKREGGGLEAPRVHVVRPGIFERWMREHGKWGGQSKMPRCRSDRQTADELARLDSIALVGGPQAPPAKTSPDLARAMLTKDTCPKQGFGQS